MKKYLNKIRKIVSNEKDSVVLKNILGAFFIKGGALVISLLTMPAYIIFFDNQEVLGLWFTVLSVMTWILSFDFGIGNGLRNKLVGLISRNNKKEIKAHISSAYIIITFVVILSISIGLIFSSFIDWNEVFSISKKVISEKAMLFTIRSIFIGIMLQFLLRLITSILYAMQKSALTNLLALVTSVLQLLFIVVLPNINLETNLMVLSLTYILSVNVPLLLATFLVFKKDLTGCSPNIKYFNLKVAIDILSLGGVFFWNQIMYMIITVTNEFFITKFSGPEYVVEYSIYNKLFTVVGSLFMISLAPMWSAITKAINEKDKDWLLKTYKILNYAVIIAVILEISLIPFLQFLTNIWLGDNSIVINYFYALTFAIYGSIFIYQSVLSTIACGMGKMRLQAICYSGAVVFKFIIIYFGFKFYDSWIIVIIANIITLLPYCILQPIDLKKNINVI